MPISKIYRLAYIHIPRTGGTYIEHLMGIHLEKKDSGLGGAYNRFGDVEHLFGRNMQHLCYRDMITLLGSESKNYEWITIIRKPEDRMISILNHTLKYPKAVNSLRVLMLALSNILILKLKNIIKQSLLYKILIRDLGQIRIDSPPIQHLRQQYYYLNVDKKYFKKRNIEVPDISLYPFFVLSKMSDLHPKLIKENYIKGEKPNASTEKYEPSKINLLLLNIFAKIIWPKDYKLYKKIEDYWIDKREPLIFKNSF